MKAKYLYVFFLLNLIAYISSSQGMQPNPIKTFFIIQPNIENPFTNNEPHSRTKQFKEDQKQPNHTK